MVRWSYRVSALVLLDLAAAAILFAAYAVLPSRLSGSALAAVSDSLNAPVEFGYGLLVGISLGLGQVSSLRRKSGPRPVVSWLAGMAVATALTVAWAYGSATPEVAARRGMYVYPWALSVLLSVGALWLSAAVTVVAAFFWARVRHGKAQEGSPA